MKKEILILVCALCLSFGAMAQVVYDETFTGTTLVPNWGAPSAHYTLTQNNKLIVTMLDSVGPKQTPTSPAGAYNNFYLHFHRCFQYGRRL